MEKRKSTRVEFLTETEMLHNGKAIIGSVDNLSLKGMFVQTNDNDVPLNTVVDCHIKLSGSSTLLSIDIKGVVARIGDTGLAIEFQDMELDSFIHLRNIIRYADKELQEYYKPE